MTICVWLASYPRSGNTWMRALWTGYRDAAGAVSINALVPTPIVSRRSLLDDELPCATGDLTRRELLLMRPHALREIARREAPGPLVFKVHDAFESNASGEPSLPADVTRCAVYVVRNPLDVCVSYAHHQGCSVEAALSTMNDPSHTIAAPRAGLAPQTPQHLGTWSGHVRSWLDEAPFPVHLVRYEDLLRDTAGVFSKALRAMSIEPERERVERAVQAARFSRLKEEEARDGFAERDPRFVPFFRSGRSGAWREEMTLDQARRLVAAHAETMARLGYSTILTENAHPTLPMTAPSVIP